MLTAEMPLAHRAIGGPEAPPQPVRAIGRGVPLPTGAINLIDLGSPVFAIAVHGDPGPQGSKSFKGMRKGKPVLVESSPLVKPWRAAVLKAAQAARPLTWDVLDGPLVADMVFTLPKPKNRPKTLRVLPHTIPDLDKLARATGDALGEDSKELGRPLIGDDSRIVEYRRLAKVYVGDTYDHDALERPGAVIRLWKYPPHLLGRLGAATDFILQA